MKPFSNFRHYEFKKVFFLFPKAGFLQTSSSYLNIYEVKTIFHVYIKQIFETQSHMIFVFKLFAYLWFLKKYSKICFIYIFTSLFLLQRLEDPNNYDSLLYKVEIMYPSKYVFLNALSHVFCAGLYIIFILYINYQYFTHNFSTRVILIIITN